MIVAEKPNSMRRLAAVQIRFQGSEAVRSYLIVHANSNRGPGRTQTPASWRVSSSKLPAGYDLRERADAKALEVILAKIDLANAV